MSTDIRDTGKHCLWILLVLWPGTAISQGTLDLVDFEPLVGQWQGELVYVDYGDDATRVSLPTWLDCKKSKKGDSLRLEYRYSEPDGSKVDGFEMLRIPKQQGMLFFDGLFAIEQAEQSDRGTLERLVLTAEGEDNGRPAEIRKTILIDGESLVLRKEVQYEGQDVSFVRNEYRLRRSP